MLTYSQGSSVSIDNEYVATGFLPVIRCKKAITEVVVDGMDDLTFVREKIFSSAHSGYVIFKNEMEASDPIESCPGVTAGGLLVVTDEFVSVIYTKASPEFEIVRLNGARLKKDFTDISPLSYIASEAARIIGSPAEAYLPIEGGAVESFGSKIAMNLPECSSAIFMNGQPFALFGLRGGTLSLNVIPTTKAGLAKAILRGSLVESPFFELPSNEGMIITPATRARSESFYNDLASGSLIAKPEWCKRVLRPDSILEYVSSNFNFLTHSTPERFEAATSVFFLPGDKMVGLLLKEYVNEPTSQNVGALLGGESMEDIVERYKAELSALISDAKGQLAVAYSKVVRDCINQILCTKPTVTLNFVIGGSDKEDEGEVKQGLASFKSQFFANQSRPSVTLYNIPFEQPLSLRDVRDISEADVKLAQPEELDEMLQQVSADMTKMGALVDIKKSEIKLTGVEETETSATVNSFFFSKDKLNKLFDDKLRNPLTDAILSEIRSLSTTFETTEYSFSPKMSSYEVDRGCGDTTTHPYHSYVEEYHTAMEGGPFREFYLHSKMNRNGSLSPTGEPLCKANRLSSISASSPFVDPLTGQLTFTLTMELELNLLPVRHGRFDFANVLNDGTTIVRNILRPLGYEVKYGGAYSYTTMLSRLFGGANHAVTYSSWDKDAPRFNNLLAFTISKVIRIDALGATDFSSSAVALAIQENLTSTNHAAQKAASDFLLRELTNAGLLDAGSIVAEIGHSMGRVRDVCHFMNASSDAGIIPFMKAYAKTAYGQQEGGGYLVDSVEARETALANYSELLTAVKTMGYTANYSAELDELSCVQTEVVDKPWLSNALQADCVGLDIDLRLLPFNLVI